MDAKGTMQSRIQAVQFEERAPGKPIRKQAVEEFPKQACFSIKLMKLKFAPAAWGPDRINRFGKSATWKPRKVLVPGAHLSLS